MDDIITHHRTLTPRPFWVPPEVNFDELPPGLQQAIAEIVNAAYQELVCGGATALARAQGLSYVELLWWEVLLQTELGQEWARNLPYGSARRATRAKLNRLLKTVALKDKIANFLQETEKFYTRIGAINQ